MAPWAIVTGVYPAVPAANLATLAFNFLKDPQRFAVTRDQIAMGPNYIDGGDAPWSCGGFCA